MNRLSLDPSQNVKKIESQNQHFQQKKKKKKKLDKHQTGALTQVAGIYNIGPPRLASIPPQLLLNGVYVYVLIASRSLRTSSRQTANVNNAR